VGRMLVRLRMRRTTVGCTKNLVELYYIENRLDTYPPIYQYLTFYFNLNTLGYISSVYWVWDTTPT
jgi:hypothetical protein